MLLVERHMIKKGGSFYDELDNICFLSKNLYNAGLYSIRQHFFKEGDYLNYNTVQKAFQEENNVDYRKLPSKVAQQTLMTLDRNFKSFFALIKKKKTDGEYKQRIKIPKYLDKKNGRFLTVYTKQALSFKTQGYVKLSGTDVLIKTDKQNINQVRVTKGGVNRVLVEVVYETPNVHMLQNNGRYASIDLGVNNLFTVASNVIKPVLVNGRPLKSINQFFNKTKAEKQSKLPHIINKKGEKVQRKTSKKINSLNRKRKNKVRDFLHKSTTIVVNHLVANNITTLVIGQNKSWKQDINIGKKNNQNFVCIPHSQAVDMLNYKCRLRGITVITINESYTSKCSFVDNEEVKKHQKYKGKRICRGVFKTQNGKLINADLNGALNILKKAIGEFKYSIEVCSTPSTLVVKYK